MLRGITALATFVITSKRKQLTFRLFGTTIRFLAMKPTTQHMKVTTHDGRELGVETYYADSTDKLAIVMPGSVYGNRVIARPYDAIAQYLAENGVTTVLPENRVSNHAKKAPRAAEEDQNLDRIMEFVSNTMPLEETNTSILAFMSGAATVVRNLGKYGNLFDSVALVSPDKDAEALVQVANYYGNFAVIAPRGGSDMAEKLCNRSGSKQKVLDVFADRDPTLRYLAKDPDEFAKLGDYILTPLLKEAA